MELVMSSEQWWRTWFHHGHPTTVNEPKQIEIHSIYVIIQKMSSDNQRPPAELGV